jgi:LmbE family N-acetylglucosaminyl deacetylase
LTCDSKRLLVFSPHLDDAVLSMGATIAGRSLRGARTEVLTVFSGANPSKISPFAQKFHAACGLGSNAVSQRIEEDTAALATLGVEGFRLPFLDAMYRRAAGNNWLYPDGLALFSAQKPPESELKKQVYRALAARHRVVQPELIATCAAIGGHVDHLITRDVVMQLAAATGTPLFLWEDIPYATGLVTADVGHPLLMAPEAAAWDLKWRSIRAYRTQLQKMWPNDNNWQQRLAEHALYRGVTRQAEIFWEVARPPLGQSPYPNKSQFSVTSG